MVVERAPEQSKVVGARLLAGLAFIAWSYDARPILRASPIVVVAVDDAAWQFVAVYQPATLSPCGVSVRGRGKRVGQGKREGGRALLEADVPCRREHRRDEHRIPHPHAHTLLPHARTPARSALRLPRPRPPHATIVPVLHHRQHPHSRRPQRRGHSYPHHRHSTAPLRSGLSLETSVSFRLPRRKRLCTIHRSFTIARPVVSLPRRSPRLARRSGLKWEVRLAS